MNKKIILFLVSLFCIQIALYPSFSANKKKKQKTKKTAATKKKKKKKATTSAHLQEVDYTTIVNLTGDTALWVEKQMSLMNDTQRIGQLFMLAAYSNKDSVKTKNLPQLISSYNIGGVIMMQGNPYRHAVKLNYYQSISKIPLLVGFDGEWGLAMRLDSTIQYPHQLTLGAIKNDSLIYKMGVAIGTECKRMGIHINFAPVVDVNNNANNPVINDRSFGENTDNVIRKSLAYMNGMHQAGILSCAKHFPGHGNTDVDSHKDLPVLNFTKSQLDSFELKPFKALIEAGVPSIMVAHLAIPQIEPDVKTPASLSQNLVQDLLKTEMKYNGLVITDAMNMSGITKYYEPGMADVKALLAGNDMLLFSSDIAISIQEIFKAIDKKLITQEEIDNRVRKILYYKYKVGLSQYQPVELKNIYNDLHQATHLKLLNQLYEQSITAINKATNNNINNEKVAFINIADSITITSKIISNNADVKVFTISPSKTEGDFNKLLDSIQSFDYVWIELHKMSRFSGRNYGISQTTQNFIEQVSSRKKTGLIVFGNPYCLKFFDNCNQVVVTYEDNAITQETIAQHFITNIKSEGALPITASNIYTYCKGNQLQPHLTLKSTNTYEINALAVGINYKTLKKIDSIALAGIAAKAYPGCVITAIKDGKIIYNKSFGTPTYENKVPVKTTDIYDLASITKIAFTTIACMKLYEDGMLDLNKTIADYLPEAKRTNKKKIVIKDLLLHQAGLVPFIPFWKDCIKKDGSLDKTFANNQDNHYTIKVANELFMDEDYIKTMWSKIYKSDIKTPGKYVYSDLDLYFMKRICESILKNKTLDEYVNEIIYKPLGLKSLCFNPLEKGIEKNRIMPTERDEYFRNQLVWGYVHDQGAAMCGGIQGHAGLFGSAEDLAQLMLMLCNKGELNGKRIFKKETVDFFTSRQSNISRRGLGFDKQEPNTALASPMCKSASAETFGHTGFTGTSAWADPKNKIVFVFLSNRIYPNAENKKIITMSTRSAIQEVIYEAMKK